MSIDPTHFSIRMPISPEQGEEAKALLTAYEDWAHCKVYEETYTGQPSPDDLAFFERVFNPDFEDMTAIEVLIKGDRVSIDDYAGDPNVQFAGDFASALLDRFDIDATVDLNWSGSHSGHATIERSSITWPDHIQATREEAPQP